MQEKTTTKPKKDLSQIGGWLIFFIVGLGLSIIVNGIALLAYPSAFNDLTSLRVEMPDFVDAMMPALWFEIIQFSALILTAAALIVILVLRKAVAKTVAIAFLAGAAITNIIDYAWVAQIFNAFELDVSMLGDVTGDIVRSLLGAAVWIPYFLVSKRVKAALTK